MTSRMRWQPPGTSAVSPWVKRRMLVASGLLGCLLVVLGYKAYTLQIDEGPRYSQLAERQHLRTVEVPAPRGNVVDRMGNELAVTAEIDSVFANPRKVEDVTGTAKAMADVLGLDAAELEKRLGSNTYFAWIKRHVTQAEADAVRELDLPGIGLTPEPRRYYPSGNLAGPVLGLAGVDGRGLDGVELSMNALLSGKRASVSAVRDATGQLVIDSADDITPEPGATVTLTLDRYVQFVSERALSEVVAANQARSGVAVVLDVATGSVLSLASYPSYDPNDPSHAVTGGARNRAITDSFEIGSVMKVFSIGAALDAGAVEPTTVIDVENGRLRIGRKTIRDSFHDKTLTVGGVLKRSSNVGAIKIARLLGAERLHDAYVRFGFGAKTGIELPGERTGYVRPADRWGQTALAAASYGYDMTATPLQVTAALAAVGNGGMYIEPRIIERVTDGNGKTLYQREPAPRRIMKQQTADALLPMLASVFDKGRYGGTARELDVPGFRAGGKSGTAHKVDPATRKYSSHLYRSSFAGLAPIDAPKIAVLVMVDEPADQHYGAVVAGPAFARIVSDTLRYLGLPADPAAAPAVASAVHGRPTDSPKQEAASPDSPSARDDLEIIELVEPGPGTVEIPDFSNLGIAHALELARPLGLPIAIEGSGRAVSQSPPPGLARNPSELRIVFAGVGG